MGVGGAGLKVSGRLFMRLARVRAKRREAMKIFVTGASGYIGSSVCAALARAGHEVHGLVRSAEKGKALARSEVQPVVGTMQEPESYRAVARQCHVLVHAAAEYSAQYMPLDRQTLEALLASASASGQPRLLVYTSGVWVYGSTEGLADEGTVLNAPAFVAQRVHHEELVLKASSGPVRSIVIRPGCVYGGRGGMTGSWFESATTEGAARIVGDGRFRWSMVHVEDLADLYLRACESGLGGEVFNATDRSRFTVLECARAASLAAGAGGKVATMAASDAGAALGAPFVECLLLDQHVDSSKAVRLLGWQPRHGGFADGASRYFQAWKAAR